MKREMLEKKLEFLMERLNLLDNDFPSKQQQDYLIYEIDKTHTDLLKLETQAFVRGLEHDE